MNCVLPSMPTLGASDLRLQPEGCHKLRFKVFPAEGGSFPEIALALSNRICRLPFGEWTAKYGEVKGICPSSARIRRNRWCVTRFAHTFNGKSLFAQRGACLRLQTLSVFDWSLEMTSSDWRHS